MALQGNEVLFVQGVQANGKLSPVTEQTTTGAIAALSSRSSGNSITSITTVGNGVLTAAGIVSGIISRSGPVAAYTDTTDTAAAIYAASGSVTGETFYVRIKNTTAFAETLAAGTGVTLGTNIVVPANAVSTYLVTIVSPTSVTFSHISTTSIVIMPTQAIVATADNGTTQTLTAAMVTGANFVAHVSSGGTTPSLTVPLATDLIAAIPAWRVGQSYTLRIINSNSGTATVVTNTGVTTTGTLTLATNSWRDFIITMATATTITMVSIGTGTNS